MMETEIRALVDDAPALQEKLREMEFKSEPEYEQHDIMLDKPDASLFRSGQKIRIRIEKGKATLTYKGHFQKGAAVSHRKEINVEIAPGKVQEYIALFEGIGFPVCFQIKKTRKVFRKGSLDVTFDEWPVIGCLLEIEGPEAEARKLAAGIAPSKEFRNYRLKELFRLKEKETGKSITELKEEHQKNEYK